MMELLALLALVLALVALVRSNGDKQRLQHLEQAFTHLSRDVAALNARQPVQEEPVAAEQQSQPMAPPLAEAISPVAEPEMLRAAPAAEEVAPASVPRQETAPTTKSIEETLTSRWLVWVGALAIALAGTFLVRYAIENGLLGPGARVTLGLLLGVALIVGGEWLRQRPLERAIAAVRANQVPPALTASGLFVCFASIYAAYALYDMIAPVIAFIALAVVALLGVGVSLLQGRFVALLGLLGAFVTPALIQTSAPSAWNLFFYLLIVECACLAVARYRAWWWLALATLAGAGAWPFLWMVSTNWTAADAVPLGLFLLLTVIAFFATRRGVPDPEGQEDWAEEVRSLAMPEWVVWIAACTVAAVQFVVVAWSGYSGAALILTAILAVLYVAMGRRHAIFDSLPVVAAALALAIAATMPGPQDAITALHHVKANLAAMQNFEMVAGGFGALFGLSGLFVLWGAKRPALWAAVSAATPVLLLILAYWRFTDFEISTSWAGLALALAGLSAVAAERVERYRTARGLENALAFYAAAVVALISLAAAMIMREAWLTVALSLQLPALAWINMRVRVRSLQVIAAIVAVNVLVRLVFNYNILGYPLGAYAPLSWVLYGYGVPALSFYAAARQFRALDNRRLVALLEAGSLAFTVLLISLEIRLFITGSLSAMSYSLLEQSLHSIAWASIGTALTIWTRRSENKVLFIGAMILLAASAAQVVLLQLWTSNPLWSGESVGHYPVVNVLFLAYAVPAAIALAFSVQPNMTKIPNLPDFAGGLGFVLIFAYVSFETTRAFQGPIFSTLHHSDGELYAYSVVWLAYALALLTLGIVLARSALRYASLAVLVVTVLKVFLFDMAGLTGLYRVGSFFGLGLSLIGIGYLYQRFVFPRPRAVPTD